MGYKRKEYENMENLFTNGKKKFVKYEEGAAMYSMQLRIATVLLRKTDRWDAPFAFSAGGVI